MMTSAPALTAALELIQTDARLVQLKLQAQEEVVKHRGHGECNPPASSSNLVSAITSSKVQQLQQQQVKSHNVPHTQGGLCSHRQLSAVLQVCKEHWQKLVQERLEAAQMLLPDIPVISASRQQLDDTDLQPTGTEDSAAWRQIGHKHSPWIPGLDAAADCIKLFYTAEDPLQALTTLVSVACCSDASCPNCSSHVDCSSRSASGSNRNSQQLEPQTVQVTLLQTVHAPNRMWLQSFFACLHPDRRQVGLDDVLHTWYRDQQVQQARNLASSCSAAACREAARTGVPASERPWVWATALGLPACPRGRGGSCSAGTGGVSSSCLKGAAGTNPADCAGQRGAWWQLPSPRDEEKLQLLCSSVKQQAMLVDVLTCADAQQTADSAHYFCFEEAMRAVLLAFSRDSSVAAQATSPAHPVLTAQATAAGAQQPQRVYPPSGVLPFQGLSAYLAPLCYLYDSPAAMYPVWHAMYCQYWCKLHAVSSSPAPAAGLPVLCRTFLDLLQEVDLEVHHHLGSLTSTPLDLVFPWLFSAFAAHLTPSETLLLWDRIIGFDSLLPLPVLAVAVLTFRRDLVLAAETSEELAELLQDLGQLRVVPLLQALLFDA